MVDKIGYIPGNFLISVSKAMKVSKSTVKTYDNKSVSTIRLNLVNTATNSTSVDLVLID